MFTLKTTVKSLLTIVQALPSPGSPRRFHCSHWLQPGAPLTNECGVAAELTLRPPQWITSVLGRELPSQHRSQ